MPLWQISTKKVAFMKNFHQILFGWKISTTTGFVGKFSQKVALFEHFHNTLFSWKFSKINPFWKHLPIICFVGKFPKKNLRYKFPPKFAFLENLHSNLLCLKIFHKKMRFWKISTKNKFVEKFQLKNVLFENFHKNLFVENFSKKLICKNISRTICIVGKISTKLLFIKISTKLRFVRIFFTKNCLVGRFPQKYALLDNFH